MLIHAAVFVVLGAIFGFFGGMFGIGGGIVAIPILGIFFGLSEQVAQGTALVMIAPNVVVGLWRYLRSVAIDWRIVGAIALTAFPLTYWASRLATLMSSSDLRLAFLIFMLLLAAYSLYRAVVAGRKAQRPALGWPWGIVVGIGSGLLNGLFTIGGATFAVPILASYFGLTQAMAQATALAVVVPGIVLSTWVYATAGDVDWAAGIPLAVGGVFAVPFGVAYAVKLPDRALRFAFVGFLLVCAAGLYLRVRS